LNTFLRFNKIRLLTSSVDQIAKAIKHSTRLELNEAKSMVRRVDAFVEPTQKDVDKKTIYVVSVK
jgi:La-related protein 7